MVEQSLHLLTNKFVSSFYMPEEHLNDPYVDEAIRQNMWAIFQSTQAGWVIVRRRVVYQD
jgi:hypothetical protein